MVLELRWSVTNALALHFASNEGSLRPQSEHLLPCHEEAASNSRPAQIGWLHRTSKAGCKGLP